MLRIVPSGFVGLNLFNPHNNQGREELSNLPSHIANKWQGWDLNPDSLAPETKIKTILLCNVRSYLSGRRFWTEELKT